MKKRDINKKGIKLYNVMFPVWMLWLFPQSWLVILPLNLAIDAFVVWFAFKRLGLDNPYERLKKVVWKVWIAGFLADFLATAVMFLPNALSFNNADFAYWWTQNLANPVCYDPFASIYGCLWVTACVAIGALLIYLFNSAFCLKAANLSDTDRKFSAALLAAITAPWLFYLPSVWFYS